MSDLPKEFAEAEETAEEIAKKVKDEVIKINKELVEGAEDFAERVDDAAEGK